MWHRLKINICVCVVTATTFLIIIFIIFASFENFYSRNFGQQMQRSRWHPLISVFAFLVCKPGCVFLISGSFIILCAFYCKCARCLTSVSFQSIIGKKVFFFIEFEPFSRGRGRDRHRERDRAREKLKRTHIFICAIFIPFYK